MKVFEEEYAEHFDSTVCALQFLRIPDAEEWAQAAWAKMFGVWSTVEYPKKLSVHAACNLYIMSIRKGRSNKKYLHNLRADDFVTGLDIRNLDFEDILKIFDKEDHDLIRLRIAEGLEYKELGPKLGIHPTTCKVRMCRILPEAKKRLLRKPLRATMGLGGY